jgi:hypothetical protein
MLMNNLPTVRIGKSLLVEREVLAGWLGRLADAEDPAAELASMRAEGKPPIVRRKLRELVQRDVAAGESSLPANVHLETGSLAVTFTTVEELATALWRLAMLLEEDLDGFALLYEPAPDTEDDQEEDRMERADVAYIREWLAEQTAEGQSS